MILGKRGGGAGSRHGVMAITAARIRDQAIFFAMWTLPGASCRAFYRRLLKEALQDSSLLDLKKRRVMSLQMK